MTAILRHREWVTLPHADLFRAAAELLGCGGSRELTWVFLEQVRVRIQLLARPVEPRGSCDGIDPTPVTVTLPDPLGHRVPEDVVNHDICVGCAG